MNKSNNIEELIELHQRNRRIYAKDRNDNKYIRNINAKDINNDMRYR